MKPFAEPTPEHIDELLQFLPIFERDGFVASTPPSEPLTMDNLFALEDELAPEVRDFIHAAYEGGFVFSYPWTEWQDTAERYVCEPDTLAQANLEDVCKLLTCHLRKERFCSGHLAAMFSCGHMVQVLQRLKVLQAQMVEG